VRSTLRLSTALALLVFALPSLKAADTASAANEREYPASIPDLKAALQKAGAYNGARLPTLEGFIQTERVQLDHYQQPYYEFKVELVPAGGGKTLVRVKANVSAWYSDPDGKHQGYRVLRSNGRLEDDLLDRLGNYLAQNKPTLVAPPGSPEEQIAAARAQRLEGERNLADLEHKLEALNTATQPTTGKFIAVAKPNIPVFDHPAASAAVLLKAQPEDEFEILENRGTWIRVKLDGARSGWVKSSQIQLNVPVSSDFSVAQDKVVALPADFTIVRESTYTFSGDWIRLKGKPSLFVWAQPALHIPNNTGESKLRFVQAIFTERYREATHSSDNSVQGIVVIFLDHRGGVAAASLDDIGSWLDGTLTRSAFLRKCSLDPPAEFAQLPKRTSQPTKTHSRASFKRPSE